MFVLWGLPPIPDPPTFHGVQTECEFILECSPILRSPSHISSPRPRVPVPTSRLEELLPGSLWGAGIPSQGSPPAPSSTLDPGSGPDVHPGNGDSAAGSGSRRVRMFLEITAGTGNAVGSAGAGRGSCPHP